MRRDSQICTPKGGARTCVLQVVRCASRQLSAHKKRTSGQNLTICQKTHVVQTFRPGRRETVGSHDPFPSLFFSLRVSLSAHVLFAALCRPALVATFSPRLVGVSSTRLTETMDAPRDLRPSFKARWTSKWSELCRLYPFDLGTLPAKIQEAAGRCTFESLNKVSLCLMHRGLRLGGATHLICGGGSLASPGRCVVCVVRQLLQYKYGSKEGLGRLLAAGVVPFDFVTVGLWGLSLNLSVSLQASPHAMPKLYLPFKKLLAFTSADKWCLILIPGTHALMLVRDGPMLWSLLGLGLVQSSSMGPVSLQSPIVHLLHSPKVCFTTSTWWTKRLSRSGAAASIPWSPPSSISHDMGRIRRERAWTTGRGASTSTTPPTTRTAIP